MALTHLQSPSAALDAFATTEGSKSGLGKNSVRILCIMWGAMVSFLYSVLCEMKIDLLFTKFKLITTFELSKKSQVV